MRLTARFINIGRGNSVNEAALLAALSQKRIAGAALDVFREEPLSPDSVFWRTPGLIVSPHVSGDYKGYEQAMCAQFLENLERYTRGAKVINIVDKQAGYVTAA